MLSGGSDLSRSSLRIAHDGEFYRRLISREAAGSGAAAAPSFRACDGGGPGCGVPFEWESRPGTPKHPSSQAAGALPPLTPPPSYQLLSSPMRAGGAAGKHAPAAGKARLLGAVLPRLAGWRKPRAPSPSVHALPADASAFSPARSCGRRGRRRHPGGAGWPFAEPTEDHGEEGSTDAGWRSSTPCFGMRHGSRRGCGGAAIGKNSFHLPWM